MRNDNRRAYLTQLRIKRQRRADHHFVFAAHGDAVDAVNRHLGAAGLGRLQSLIAGQRGLEDRRPDQLIFGDIAKAHLALVVKVSAQIARDAKFGYHRFAHAAQHLADIKVGFNAPVVVGKAAKVAVDRAKRDIKGRDSNAHHVTDRFGDKTGDGIGGLCHRLCTGGQHISEGWRAGWARDLNPFPFFVFGIALLLGWITRSVGALDRTGLHLVTGRLERIADSVQGIKDQAAAHDKAHLAAAGEVKAAVERPGIQLHLAFGKVAHHIAGETKAPFANLGVGPANLKGVQQFGDPANVRAPFRVPDQFAGGLHLHQIERAGLRHAVKG